MSETSPRRVCSVETLCPVCLQNFHLMDYHLATFITVMLARRLVWTIVSEVGAPEARLNKLIDSDTHPCS